MTKAYNLKNIRTLLTEGFSPEDLRYFAHDTPNFKAVYNELAQRTGKAEIAHRLLEYANQQGRIDELLAWAKEQNSLGYEKHGLYYESAGGGGIDEAEVNVLLEQAETHLAAGEWKEAVQEAIAALKLDHRSSRALVIRAEAYAGLDRWDDVIRDATEALGIDPRNVRAWCVRAGAYLNLGHRLDDVIRDTTEALGIEPQNLLALAIRARAYRGMGRENEAIRDATEALGIEPIDNNDVTDLAVALGIRALAYNSLARFDKAGQDAEQYLELEIKPTFIFKLDRLERIRDAMLDVIEKIHRHGESPATSVKPPQSTGALGDLR
jgi:tetratricopeptide (TPR) repeat protein